MTSFVKRVGFLRKRTDLSIEDFHNHWISRHAGLCKKLPGLRRYATNLINRNKFHNAKWDGFSELWFDSLEAHDAAFASPEGKILLADAHNFAEELYGVIVVETVHI